MDTAIDISIGLCGRAEDDVTATGPQPAARG